MILAVDIGNSNIVLGGLQGEKVAFEARLRTEPTKTSDEYCVDMKTLMDVYGVQAHEFEGAIIASVVPQVLNSFQTAIRKLIGKTSLVVGPGIKTGLNLRIENPSQMGADLVAADVAALRNHKPPLIVIDMGTATTLSVLDKDGAHIGGCVCPGVRVSADALTEKAALLPRLQLDRPKRTIGKSTVEAMRSGIMLGTACMIDGLIERMEEELGYPATVIATGGIAKFIVPLCKTPILYDKNLLLKGLGALYYDNRRAESAKRREE